MSYVAYPRGPRYAAIGFSVVLVVAAVAIGVFLGEDVRSRFTVLQAITLAVFVIFSVGFMLSLGFCTVQVRQAGLWFRNGIRTHEVPWSDVGRFRFGDGDPWPHVVLRAENADGEHDELALMGIQGSDGAYARDQYDRLLDAVAEAASGDAGTESPA